MFISVEKALEIINSLEPCPAAEEISVYECCGRTAAEDLLAGLSQPPFPRSPLDGYAFRSEDVKGACPEKPAVLKETGVALAGCSTRFYVEPGCCLRIMTGSPIPEGSDAVIGIEDVLVREDGRVEILKEIGHFGNYVFEGEDFREGQLLVKKGCRIDAAAAGCLAAAGYASVPVLRRPPVAILATGSEIASPGSPLQYGSIYDSNSVYLNARLLSFGFKPKKAILKDCRETIEEALISTAEALIEEQTTEGKENSASNRGKMPGIIITTGGVSVGDADYMPQVLAALGAEILFKGVALKPGSPIMLAKYKNCYLICLSGNPYAAAATFELFARPLISRISGENIAMKTREAELAMDFRKGSRVPRFLRAKLEAGKVVSPEGHSSGQLYTLQGCNCLARLPEGEGPFPKGTKVKIYLL